MQLWPRGDRGFSLTARLTCEPAGGTHPRPAPACRALFGHAEALGPVPADVACTELYGGPQRARISGALRDREIDVSLERTNGCEIDRWDRLAPVLRLRD